VIDVGRAPTFAHDAALDCETKARDPRLSAVVGKKRPRYSVPPDARSTSDVTLSTPFTSPVISNGSLVGGASRQAGTIVVRLLGSADFAMSAELDEFLAHVHLESMRLGITLVALDIRGLHFMNSSCIRSVTSWICGVAALPEEDQYRIRLESNPTFHWQSKSIHALRNLAPHLIDVEEGR